MKPRAENGADFADLVGVARGDEQRRHARSLTKIFRQASLTRKFFAAKWADEITPVARLLLRLRPESPRRRQNAPAAPYILTPPAPATPRINGPDVFGVRPGSPFLYTIPATGDRPMTFSARNLPAGLKLDSKTGRITGSLPKAMPTPANAKGGYFLSHPVQVSGTYVVTLVAQNSLGTAEKKFRIVVGDQIALTPQMGWNSWNCFAGAVSEERVKSAADAMVKSGLINHGWTYINVDDYWQNHRNSKDPTLRGPFRDTNGVIVPNSRFPDMKGMADYIHGLGLKAGLYSSPGPWTCGNCAASWQHEEQDAQTYAKWGFDYLK